MVNVLIDKDKLNRCTEEICDEYCIWPSECPTQERLDMHCADCPLANLTNEGWWQERGNDE